jgi:hypothetical protein
MLAKPRNGVNGKYVLVCARRLHKIGKLLEHICPIDLWSRPFLISRVCNLLIMCGLIFGLPTAGSCIQIAY